MSTALVTVLAVGTGVVVIIVAIAVVLVVLLVTLSMRDRRKRDAQARRDLDEAHERAGARSGIAISPRSRPSREPIQTSSLAQPLVHGPSRRSARSWCKARISTSLERSRLPRGTGRSTIRQNIR